MLTTIIGSSASSAIGIAVGGILAVLVISAVFYVIGRGEDRDRAQAAQPAPTSPPRDEPGERPGDLPSAELPDEEPDDRPGERLDEQSAQVASRPRLPASARRRRRR